MRYKSPYHHFRQTVEAWTHFTGKGVLVWLVIVNGFYIVQSKKRTGVTYCWMQGLVRLLYPTGQEEHHTCSILWVHPMWGLHKKGERQVRSYFITFTCQLFLDAVYGHWSFPLFSPHSELVLVPHMQCNLQQVVATFVVWIYKFMVSPLCCW